jgi:hypothetical protein
VIAVEPAWREILHRLDYLEWYLDNNEPEDHRLDARDTSGETYCLGCEVGQLAQSLRLELLSYLAARGHNITELTRERV